MKSFLVITNIAKDIGMKLTDAIKEYIDAHGGECRTIPYKLDRNENYHMSEYGDVDCIIVIGGDGTILQVARDVAGKDIPLLGVNLGTLGFLAEVEPEHIEEALSRLMADDYEVQPRMMLQGKVISSGGFERSISPALNDITIARNGSLQIIRFSVYVNGEYLCDYSADGMIVATPTGSTGYNMSAGGPIVQPGASMMVLTPICAHNMNTRSIVLRATDTIEIVMGTGRDGQDINVEASADGSESMTVKTGEKIVINKSENTALMVKINNESFVQKLHKKMSE